MVQSNFFSLSILEAFGNKIILIGDINAITMLNKLMQNATLPASSSEK